MSKYGHRIKIVMDEKSEIEPDFEDNYVLGAWDLSLEFAIEEAMDLQRTILVIRPEGLCFAKDKLYLNEKKRE